ncbi:retron system putative HNH endonuclease [Burkholderia glumae]|uniref:retron system putative HNH endonuclease n=1 Tax=Burkholderia glumae TaxID=337 RepID=UPI001AEA4B6C|nr:retron system putative HNH endonuclease [Burkholderia glumae]
MKRVTKAAVAPSLLRRFSAARPDADWDQFRQSDGRYRETAAQIRLDQRGICAYCEIDLLKADAPNKLPDFRIEHFHPKAPHAPPPNWATDWTNLLGSCHGGSQRDVADPNRFTPPDFSCDVPKADNDWTADIFNPLTDVPAFPRFFKYVESDGAIAVDTDLCPEPVVGKATETIKRLNLNASRLTRMRQAVIAGLRDQIAMLLEAGATVEDASKQLSSAMFPSDADGEWPAFFTCIRWYLGSSAEDRLVEVGYS